MLILNAMMDASNEICSASVDQSLPVVIADLAKRYKSIRIALFVQKSFSKPFMNTEGVDESEVFPEKMILDNFTKFSRISQSSPGFEVDIKIELNADSNSIVVEGIEISLDNLNDIKLPWSFEKDSHSIFRALDDILEISAWGKKVLECLETKQLLTTLFEDAYENSTLLAPASWWNVAHDLKLLQLIPTCGWPDCKRRSMAILCELFGTEESSKAPLSHQAIASHLEYLVSLLRGGSVKQTKALPYSSAILRTLGRWGRPHELYTSIHKLPDSGKRPDFDLYLMSWEKFLNECGKYPGLDESRLRKFILEMTEFLCRSDGKDDKVIESGLLFGLTPKSIKDSYCKSEIMYRIRTLLAIRDDCALNGTLKQRVMPTGASVPPYARDRSMPVWWTVDHDIKLLKLTCLHGLHNWKKILAPETQVIENNGTTDSLSILEAPSDFEIPLRENGQEWVLALTAKIAEKRLSHILKVVDVFALVTNFPQSPRRNSIAQSLAKGTQTVNKKKSSSAALSWASATIPEKIVRAPLFKPALDKSQRLEAENSVEFLGVFQSADVEARGKTFVEIKKSDLPITTESVELVKHPKGDLGSGGSNRTPESLIIDISQNIPNENVCAAEVIFKDSDSIASSDFKEPNTISGSGGPCSIVSDGRVGSSAVVTEMKKRKKNDDSKATVKKPAPASKSILSFFNKLPTIADKNPVPDQAGYELNAQATTPV